MKAPAIDKLLAKGSDSFNALRAAGGLAVDHTGATFTRLYFANADLSRLGLVGTEWEDCNVGGVSFDGADLSNAYVHGGRFERCTFRGANLAGATFEDVELVDCDFTGALGLDTLELEGLGATPTRDDEAAEPGFIPGHVASHAQYEADIEANPDDEQRWLVYADWLQAQGDVRGELIARHRSAVSRSHREGGTETFAAFVDEHLEELFRDCADEVRGGGQTPELRPEWRHGLLSGATLRVENRERPIDLGALATKVLALPIARFLRRLSFGVKHDASTYGENVNDYATVIEALRTAPRAASLEHLELGLQTQYRDEYGDAVPLRTWGDLSSLWSLVPRLRTLKLKGSGGLLGRIVLPELRHFTLETDYLEDAAAFEEILAARWPNLERLELADLDGGLDEDALLRAIAPLPLTHLAIHGSPRADQVVSALLRSPVLPRLRVLDLREGALSPEGVKLLRERADAFRHLETLNLTDAVGDHAGLAALGSCVVLDDHREKDEVVDDEDGEYELDDEN